MKLTFFLILFFCNSASAFKPATFTPNVVDEVQALSEKEKQNINEKIQLLRENADVYSAVYFTSSLQNSSIETAALKTFETWQLGDSKKDNGLLFIFSINDRKARIEVGYGLEGIITDAHAKRLLDNIILPHFKNKNYAAGVLSGLETVSLIINQKPLPDNWNSSSNEVDFNHKNGKFFYGLWLLCLFLLHPLLRLLQKKLNPKKGTKVKFKHGLALMSPPKTAKASKKMPLPIAIFIKAFLSLNPGIFIYFLFAIPVFSSFDKINNLAILFSALSFLIIPMLLKIYGSYMGKKRKSKNPDSYRKSLSYLIFIFNLNSFASFIFCTVFFILNTLALDSFLKHGFELLGFLVSLITVIFFNLLFWVFSIKPLISNKIYIRNLAMFRLNKIRARTNTKREIFGRTYIPSSSSSSGSSFSSSSGGGSSGGGGASSSW